MKLTWLRQENLAENGPEIGDWRKKQPRWTYAIITRYPEAKDGMKQQMIQFTADELPEIKAMIEAIENDLLTCQIEELLTEKREIGREIEALNAE